jgi:NitT/TauT family transport system substrate-binding protein
MFDLQSCPWPRFSMNLLIVLVGIQALSACVSGGSGKAPPATTLRLGYLANLTHAPALIAVGDGSLQEELGGTVQLRAKVFNAGPAIIEAMFAGELDAAYIGPSPAINGYQRSRGEALRVVSGATTGGAQFIARPQANILVAADLAGKKIATPQLGGTQDVALRAYLSANGLKPKEKGGSVHVLPTENANILTLFQKGELDGAWVPEPWASRLIIEAGGSVFIDEADLWPGGQFVTTAIIVRTEFLKRNPGSVSALVRANVRAIDLARSDPDAAMALVNKQIEALTGKPLAVAVIERAWRNLQFTCDPVVESWTASASRAYELGLLGHSRPDIDGIFDFEALNAVLLGRKSPLGSAR